MRTRILRKVVKGAQKAHTGIVAARDMVKFICWWTGMEGGPTNYLQRFVMCNEFRPHVEKSIGTLKIVR